VTLDRLLTLLKANGFRVLVERSRDVYEKDFELTKDGISVTVKHNSGSAEVEAEACGSNLVTATMLATTSLVLSAAALVQDRKAKLMQAEALADSVDRLMTILKEADPCDPPKQS